MEKVNLGSTGEQVSALCLGTDFYGSRIDVATAHELYDAYYEAGGTFFDTANFYGSWVPGFKGGESEAALGQWIKKRQNRDELFIGTKVGFAYEDVPIGLRANLIESECEKSLKRLGIETIDIYYAHRDDRDTPHEETLAAFDRLVQAGKVRYLGVCNHSAWRVAEARTTSKINEWASYSVIQQRHTYVRPKPDSDFGVQEVVNNDMLDYCRVHGMALVAYTVILKGAYTRSDRDIPEQFNTPETEARLKALNSIANEAGATPNQVVIAWMRQSDPPVIPIIGGSKVEQLEENIGALDLTLTDDQMKRLNEAGT